MIDINFNILFSMEEGKAIFYYFDLGLVYAYFYLLFVLLILRALL